MFKCLTAIVLLFFLSTQLLFSAALLEPKESRVLGTARQLLHTFVCVTPTGVATSGGSAFPVDALHLVTAAHMSCAADEISLIDTHRNYYTEVHVVRSDNALDIMLVRINNAAEALAGPFAKFRTKPILGEPVVGFGSAFHGEIIGGFYMSGIIQGIAPTVLLNSCNIAPGMSGSALLGEDGLVVGMSIYARPTFLFAGQVPWGVVAGALPANVILKFLQQA